MVNCPYLVRFLGQINSGAPLHHFSRESCDLRVTLFRLPPPPFFRKRQTHLTITLFLLDRHTTDSQRLPNSFTASSGVVLSLSFKKPLTHFNGTAEKKRAWNGSKENDEPPVLNVKLYGLTTFPSRFIPLLFLHRHVGDRERERRGIYSQEGDSLPAAPAFGKPHRQITSNSTIFSPSLSNHFNDPLD